MEYMVARLIVWPAWLNTKWPAWLSGPPVCLARSSIGYVIITLVPWIIRSSTSWKKEQRQQQAEGEPGLGWGIRVINNARFCLVFYKSTSGVDRRGMN